MSVTQDDVKKIVVLGGGFAGTTVAIAQIDYYLEQFRRQKGDNQLPAIDIQIIDNKNEIGPGHPYHTEDDICILNQPTNSMSYNPLDSKHFTRWLNKTQNGRVYTGYEFVPRRLYGEYLKSIFQEKCDEVNALNIGLSVHTLQANIADITVHFHGTDPANDVRNSVTLHQANGQTIEADSVVLALGHQRSDKFTHYEDNPRFATGVCQTSTYRKALALVSQDPEQEKSIGIIGTGQSMMDALATLDATGYDGQIYAISQRRVEPWPYDPNDYAGQVKPYELQHFTLDYLKKHVGASFEDLQDTLRQEVEAARHHTERSYAMGHILDTINKQIIKKENHFETDEELKLKDLVHELFYKTYGNPTPPERYALYEKLKKEGRLVLLQGHVEEENVTETDHGFTVTGLTDQKTHHFNMLVNAACYDRTPLAAPLVRKLFNENIVEVTKDGKPKVTDDHKNYIFLAGAVANPRLWGVESSREQNAETGKKSIRRFTTAKPMWV